MSLKLETIIQEIKPFDLIFFKGVDWISTTVSIAEKLSGNTTEFTHVGMIVNNELISDSRLEDGVLYIFESTVADSVNDVISEKIKYGVQIRPLIDVKNAYIKNAGCHIAWAKLKRNPYNIDTLKKKSISDFQSVYNIYIKQFYNFNIIDLMGAAFPCMRKTRQILDEIIVDTAKILTTITNKKFENTNDWAFCSELVADILKSIHILPPETTVINYTPMDFLEKDVDGMPKLTYRPIYFV